MRPYDVFVVFLLLLVLLVSSTNAAPPKVTSASKYIKDLSFAGDRFRVGFIELEFDQALYVIKSFGRPCAPPPASCPAPACPPCDYTDPATCNGTHQSDPTCPCLPDFCSFPKIEVDEVPRFINRTVESGAPWWYLEMDPSLCNKAVVSKLEANNVGGNVEALKSDMSDGIWTTVTGTGYQVLCPDEWKGSVAFGMWLLCGATCYPGWVNTWMTPFYHDIPDTSIHTSCAPPSELASTHSCYNFGELVTFNPPKQNSAIRFVIPVTGGGCVTISGSSSVSAIWISPDDPWINGSYVDENTIFYHTRPFPPFANTPAYEEQELSFVYTYCLPSDQEYLYGYALVYPGLFPVRIWFDNSSAWRDLLPFDTITEAAFTHDLAHGLTLSYGDGKVVTNHAEVAPLWQSMESGVLSFRALYPSEESNFFYPPFLYRFQSDDTYTFYVPTYPAKFSPNKFIAAVVLDFDYKIAAGTVIAPLKYTFLSKEDFWSSNLTLNGNIAGSTWEPVLTTISEWSKKDTSCNYDKYLEVAQKINNLLMNMLTEEQANATKFAQDSAALDQLTNSDAYTFCQDFVKSLYTTSVDSELLTTRTSECIHDFGTDEYNSDPCCNVYLYQPCTPADRRFHLQSLDSLNYDDIEEKCPDYHCIEVAVAEYQERVATVLSPVGCRSQLPSAGAFLGDLYDKLFKCRRKFFNPIGTLGLDCDHDSDCPNGSLCGTQYGYQGCLLPWQGQLRLFLECVLDEVLTGYTREQLKQVLQVSHLDVDILIEKHSSTSCADPSGIEQCAFARRLYYSGCPATPPGGVPVCPLDDSLPYTYTLDTQDGPEYVDCAGLCGGSGFSSSLRYATIGPLQFCNWIDCVKLGYNDNTCKAMCCNSTSVGCDLSDTASFCGLCENGEECNDLSAMGLNNRQSCESAILCKLDTGDLRLVNSEEECTNLNYCTGCPTCTSQEECESDAQGACSDSYDPVYGIFHSTFMDTPGACAYKMTWSSPWIPVSQCIFPGRNTVTGYCIDNKISEANCTNTTLTYLASGLAELVDIKWVKPATTREECANWGQICWGVLKFSNAGPFDDWDATLKGDVCTEAGGTMGDIFQWKNRRWLSGQVRKLSWRPREYKPRWTTGMIFRFEDFTKSLAAANTGAYKLLQEALLFCQFAQTTQLTQTIACNCIEGTDYETCREESNLFNVDNMGAFCGNSTSDLVAGHWLLRSQEDTVREDTCYILRFLSLAAIRFKDAGLTPRISSVVVSYSEDAEWAMRNANRAIYAKPLTNGVFIGSFSNNSIYNITVRVLPHSQRRDPDMSYFSVLDIAIGTSPTDVSPVPQSLQVELKSDGYYWAVIPEVYPNSSLWVVQRVDEDWSSLGRKVFSAGEIAYLAVLLAMYVIGLMFAFWKLGRNLYFKGVFGVSYDMVKPGEIVDRLFIVIFAITVFFIFRTVFFSMLISGALYDTTSPAVDWLLIEWPIVMYFCYATNYILVWATIVKISGHLNESPEKMLDIANLITILLNIFIITLFVIFIILYETLVGEPESICAGQYILWPADTAHQLLLAYRCIFGGIDILLGFGLFIFGFLFLRILFSAPSSRMKHKRYLVLLVASIGSAGLFAQGVVWITITAIDKEQSNYLSLSLLLFVEILPSLLFLFLISEKSSAGESYKTRTRNTSAISARGSSSRPKSTV